MAKQNTPHNPPQKKKNKKEESKTNILNPKRLTMTPLCCCEPSTRHRYAHLFVQNVVSQAPDTGTLTCLCSMLWAKHHTQKLTCLCSMLRARHQTRTCSPVCAACPWCELSAGCCDSARPPDPDTQGISLTLTNTIKPPTSTQHTQTNGHTLPSRVFRRKLWTKCTSNILIPREVAWQLDVGVLAQKLSLTFSSPSHIDHRSRENDRGLCVPDKDAVWCQLAEIHIS